VGGRARSSKRRRFRKTDFTGKQVPKKMHSVITKKDENELKIVWKMRNCGNWGRRLGAINGVKWGMRKGEV